jgi:hypothetical protein
MHLQKILHLIGMLFKDSHVNQYFNFDHQHPMNYLGITAQMPSSVGRGITLSHFDVPNLLCFGLEGAVRQ